jgi:hypothetical protein
MPLRAGRITEVPFGTPGRTAQFENPLLTRVGGKAA